MGALYSCSLLGCLGWRRGTYETIQSETTTKLPGPEFERNVDIDLSEEASKDSFQTENEKEDDQNAEDRMVDNSDPETQHQNHLATQVKTSSINQNDVSKMPRRDEKKSGLLDRYFSFNKTLPNEVEELLDDSRYKQSEIKTWHSKFIKDYPDGNIDKSNFNDFYNKLYASYQNNQQKTDHIFRFFDRDADGHVSFTELMTSLTLLRRGPVKEKMEWLFQVYDVNSDGLITLEELTDVVGGMQDVSGKSHSVYKFNGTRMREIFKSVDDNCDGSLTISEFIEGIEKYEELLTILNIGQVLPFA